MQREVWAVLTARGTFIAAYPDRDIAEMLSRVDGQDIVRRATLILAGDPIAPCPSPGREWQCPLPAGHPGPCQE